MYVASYIDGLVFKRRPPSLNFTGYKVFSLSSLSLTTVGVGRAYIKKSILKVKRQRLKKKEGRRVDGFRFA